MNEDLGSSIRMFVERNCDLLKKIEGFSIAAFLLGFSLSIGKVTGGNVLLVAGAVFSGILFFLRSYEVFEIENADSWSFGGIVRMNFASKLGYISMSVGMVAMLGFVFDSFKVNSVLIASGGSLIIVLGIILFTKIKEKQKGFANTLIGKIAVCIALLIFLGIKRGLIS